MSAVTPARAADGTVVDLGLAAMKPSALAENGYAQWRDILRRTLARSGALRVERIGTLFRQWWIPQPSAAENAADAGTYVQFDHEALIGILLLEAHRAGALVVARDGHRVALVRKRSSPVEWGFPAGYLSYREDIIDAARRELLEETGLRADVTTANHVRSHRQPWMLHIDHVFLVAASGELHTRDALEIAEARWFDVDDLPPLAREARLALAEIPDLITRPIA